MDLVHTRMSVPTDRIYVSNLTQIDVGAGIAWSSDLCDGATRLGLISNDGNGSATLFYPVAAGARPTLELFVSHCSQDGQPFNEEMVLDTLVDEHVFAADVARAEHVGTFLVRYFDALDIPGLIEWRPHTRRPSSYAEALREVPHHVQLPPTAQRAELWMGDRWKEFHPT